MAGENQSWSDLARKLYLRGMTAADADGDQTDATDNAAANGILVTTVAGGSGGAVTLTDGTDTALITGSGEQLVAFASPQSVYSGNASVVTSLSAATTGTGTTADMGLVIPHCIMQVTASADLTAGVVDLEGSLDNTNWFQIVTSGDLGTAFSAAGTKAYIPSAVTPARYLRARVTTNVTGGNITVLITGCI